MWIMRWWRTNGQCTFKNVGEKEKKGSRGNEQEWHGCYRERVHLLFSDSQWSQFSSVRLCRFPISFGRPVMMTSDVAWVIQVVTFTWDDCVLWSFSILLLPFLEHAGVNILQHSFIIIVIFSVLFHE